MQFHSSNSVLILAGPPRDLKTLCKLFNNNRKVIIIVYDGFNLNRTKQMLDSLNKIDLFLRSIKYLDELGTNIGLKNNLFSGNEYTSSGLITLPEDEEERITSGIEESTILEKITTKQGVDYQMELEPYKHEGAPLTITVSQFSNFICIPNEKLIEIEEKTPRNLKEGDLILFFGNRRRDVLDIICDIENLNVDIDLEEIKIWRNKITNFIESHQMLYKTFYSLYKTKSENPKTYTSLYMWVTNRLIGPSDYKDIESISKVMEDSESITSAAYISDQMDKIRKTHLSMGRKVNGFVRSIIENKITDNGLDYESTLILKKIKIYKIKTINRLSDRKV